MKRAVIALAHHEAGHAVIARVLGLEVTYVTLSPDNSGGVAHTEWATDFACDAETYTSPKATRLWAYETDAIVCLAGPLAECRYGYQWPSRREITGWRSDLKTVTRLVNNAVVLKHGVLTEPKYDELFDQLCDKTRVLIDEHWPAIERVAQGLLHFSDLNGALVDDLIDSTSPFEQLIENGVG